MYIDTTKKFITLSHGAYKKLKNILVNSHTTGLLYNFIKL